METSRNLRRRNGTTVPQREADRIVAQIVAQKEHRTLSADEASKRFVRMFFSPCSSSNEEHEASTIEQTGAFKVSLIDPVSE
jgi:hypothetical protein